MKRLIEFSKEIAAATENIHPQNGLLAWTLSGKLFTDETVGQGWAAPGIADEYVLVRAGDTSEVVEYLICLS